MTEHYAHIWRWEQHFRISAESGAESVFGRLDPALDPRVWLVAVRRSGEHGEYDTVVVDEDTMLDPAFLDGVERPDRDSATVREELRRTIEGALRPLDERDGRTSFCGSPVTIEDWGNTFHVSIVLRLDHAAYRQYPALRTGKLWVHEFRSLDVPKSLLDAVAWQFLIVCTQSLMQREPGANLQVMGRDSEEVIREAGKVLMTIPEWNAGLKVSGSRLFQACVAVASSKYEGKEAKGGLIIARRDHPAVRYSMHLAEPLRVDDHRTLRKLLEITASKKRLVVGNGQVYGLGEVLDSYDPAEESVFTINFVRDGIWELRHMRVPLMRVRHGVPELPVPTVDRKSFEEALRSIGWQVGNSELDQLWRLLCAVTEQRHGGLLVITPDAEQEALRLKSQGFPMVPRSITPDLLGNITAIDGAVMIDLDGMCYAIGTILDGEARLGDMARGARYNSAVRYVNSHGNAIVVVVSTDGYVDIVRPREDGA